MSKTQHHTNKDLSLDLHLIDVPSIPGDPVAELAKVEAEANRVAGVLAGLLSRVNFLKAQINVSRSPFLRLLPSEIIAEIFKLCLEVPGPNHKFGQVDNTVPLKLGAVCNAFRTIAWSTPQLWAAVVLYVKSSWKIAAQTALLSDWLSRSGLLPLSIWLDSSEDMHWAFAQPEVILNVINVFSSRWKYVDIRLPSSCYPHLPPWDESLPMLESLILKPPGGQGDRSHHVEIGTAPNLRCIVLQCLYLRSIKFQWCLLTFLDLESFYIDESLEIFRQAPNLVHLNMRRILGGDDSHTLPSDPIVLSSLTSLTVVNDKATDLLPMLNKLTLPALRKISVSADGAVYSPCFSLAVVLQQSSCPLESLSLIHCTAPDPDFKILLSRIPSVKELCLDMLDSIPTASRSHLAPLTDDILQSLNPSFARLNRQDCLLPNLEKLSYTGRQEFSWSQMLQMVEARISPGEGPSTPNELPRPVNPNHVSSGFRLKEVNLRLTLSSQDEVSALTPIKPTLAQETGLNWNLETIVQT